MTADLLAKEETSGRNVNFGDNETYPVRQYVGNQRIQCVGFDALLYGIRGIFHFDSIRFSDDWFCCWSADLFLLFWVLHFVFKRA